MTFAALPFALVLIVIPALLLLYVYGFRRKRQALANFADANVVSQLLSGYSRSRQWLRAGCLLVAIGFMVLALMQPQWGNSQEDVSREGRDLIIVLDTSLSMLAEDAQPNRLSVAKAGIRALVEQLKAEGGHRLGLVAFAGRASLLCPLTLDYAFFLQRLEEADVDSVPRKGTLIGDAIRQALRGFGDLNYPYTDIILITDGEDHDSLPLEAAKVAKALQVNVYPVGIGDAREGAFIPIKNEDGEQVNLSYQDYDVRSRLRPALLLELAQNTGGVYLPAGTGALELDQLYNQYMADKPRRYLDEASGNRLAHRFQWFVSLAIIFLLLDMLLSASKRKTTA